MQNVLKKERQDEYTRYIRKKGIIIAALILLIGISCAFSLMVGSSGLTFQELIKTLFRQGTPQATAIVWNVRLPRIATAMVVGIALAMSGCIMQNVLRNPLASASTLGVSQGASFGAAVAIVYLGAGIQVNGGAGAVTITNPYLVTLCAFLGGMVTTLVILGLARMRGTNPSTMVLAGVAISSLFTGATTLVQYFCDDVVVATVVHWTFGSLGRAGWKETVLIGISCLIAFSYFYLNRWNYNAMESGTHTAKSLGVPVDTLILVSMLLCALIASVAVAFVGCISFIGLIAPHIMRKFVGNDYRFLIPCSAMMGAVLLLGADLVARILVPPTVLPIGALTSFLGAPLFLYLIIKGGKIK